MTMKNFRLFRDINIRIVSSRAKTTKKLTAKCCKAKQILFASAKYVFTKMTYFRSMGIVYEKRKRGTVGGNVRMENTSTKCSYRYFMQRARYLPNMSTLKKDNFEDFQRQES